MLPLHFLCEFIGSRVFLLVSLSTSQFFFKNWLLLVCIIMAINNISDVEFMKELRQFRVIYDRGCSKFKDRNLKVNA